MQRALLTAVVGFAVAGVTGCKGGDNTITKMQYVPDMADAPTVKTQRDYVDPPEGSVAMSAYPYPKTKEESEKLLPMPQRIAQDPAQEAQGKLMFETYCAVCHGPGAKGNGTVVPPVPQPPDLTLDLYKKRGDGFFFHTITFGGALMPPYGHATTPTERWQIVKYLRKLQQEGGG